MKINTMESCHTMIQSFSGNFEFIVLTRVLGNRMDEMKFLAISYGFIERRLEFHHI